MNRTTKYLVGIGIGGAVLAVIALAVPKAHDPAVSAVQTVPKTSVIPATALESAPAQNAVASAATESPVVAIPPLPANAVNVPDEDLLKLSASVDLSNAADHSIDKGRWAQVVPVAQKLVQGPCDCEQRNWLNHFIAMGEAARDGANDQYYQLAGLMVKLARNDKQLADDPTRSLR